MGSAIALRLGQTTLCYDHNSQKAKLLANKIGGKVLSSPLENSSPDDILLLAIKPSDFNPEDYKDFKGKLVISIMAGIKQETLQKGFSVPCLRAMPNLAVRYGFGVIAFATTPQIDQIFINTLFAPLGKILWFHEEHFPAITALTGSGPAFILRLIQAIEGASAEMGLPKEGNLALIEEMVTGTLKWLKTSQEEPETLIQQVTSKGGTTEAGLKAFEAHHVQQGLIETFLAAYRKA